MAADADPSDETANSSVGRKSAARSAALP